MAKNNIDYKEYLNKEYLKYQKDFSEERFEEKIKRFAMKIGLKTIYTALLLYYTASDEKEMIVTKSIIYGALGYFILPLDMIPDYIPGMGFTDDIAILSAVFASAKSSITEDIVNKAKEKLKSVFSWYNGEPLDI